MASTNNTTTQTQATPPTTDVIDPRKQYTPAERFISKMLLNYTTEMSVPLELTDYEKTLGQHIFLKVDAALKEQEKNRSDLNRPPIKWDNVNMTALCLDATNRVKLGLDAMINGHIYPIAIYNDKARGYTVDLRIGYRGKDYYRRKFAVDPPLDIRYELVYENDHFIPVKMDKDNPTENYVFQIKQPFNRGKIVGGFAYLVYDDPRKNKLVTMSEADFMIAKSYSFTTKMDFWGKHPEAMRKKTLVHRATDYLMADPEKINRCAEAYAAVEEQDAESVSETEAEITRNALKTPFTIPGEWATTEEPTEPTEPEEPEQPEPEPEPEKPQTSQTAETSKRDARPSF